MAALSVTTPTNSGAVTAGAAVTASDTIAVSVMGSLGAYLYISNTSGSSDNVTISDSGLTPAGNPLNLAPGGVIADTITTGTAQIYVIRPAQANPTTNLVTITHSNIGGGTTVLYQLWPVGGV